MFLKKFFNIKANKPSKNVGPYRTSSKIEKVKDAPRILKINGSYVAEYNNKKYLYIPDKFKACLNDYEFASDGCWHDQNGRQIRKDKVFKKALLNFLLEKQRKKRADELHKLLNDGVKNEI